MIKKSRKKEETKPELKAPTPPTEQEETEVQELDLTPEQQPTVITNQEGQPVMTLKTTEEKILYEILLRLDTIITQNTTTEPQS